MSEIVLKPIEDSEVGLLCRWLHKEYILKWYEDADEWLHEINNRSGEFSFINHFVAYLDGIPIGFCQYYDCFEAQEDWYAINESGAVYSIDYLIGEEDYLGWGLGKEIIKALEAEISRTTAKKIIVQPDGENLPSNRLLLSCGYRFDEGLGYYYKNI